MCLLLLQVWCRPLPEAAAAELPPLYAGLVAVPAGSDGLLGCADLDLAALTLLGALDGWYNIRDIRGHKRGQIKVWGGAKAGAMDGGRRCGYQERWCAGRRCLPVSRTGGGAQLFDVCVHICDCRELRLKIVVLLRLPLCCRRIAACLP